MIDYRKAVVFTVDMLVLIVAAFVGMLAMPIGAILGAVIVGGRVFTIIWKTLGNSKADFEKMIDEERGRS